MGFISSEDIKDLEKSLCKSNNLKLYGVFIQSCKNNIIFIGSTIKNILLFIWNMMIMVFNRFINDMTYQLGMD